MTLSDTPEWRAFVAAVKATPNDPMPRLAAADYAEEHGEGEYAAYVRAQVEGKRPKLSAPQYRRWFDIWSDAGRTFSITHGRHHTRVTERNGHGFGGGVLTIRPYSVYVRWGFIEEVRCRGDAWVGLADSAFRSHPVRTVAMTTVPEIRWWPKANQASLGLVDSPLHDVHGGLFADGEVGVGEEIPTWRFAHPMLSRQWEGVTFLVDYTVNTTLERFVL